jgi:hypothetical protein
VKRSLAVLIILIMFRVPAVVATPVPAAPCSSSASLLLAERVDRVIGIDSGTFAGIPLPVPPGVIERTADARRAFAELAPPKWTVTRVGGDRAVRVVVTARATNQVVLDESFDRRIELATVASTPDGRITLFVQANNIASEITILDAETGTVRQVRIRHSADLAAFAITIVYSPDYRCAAISMERVNGPGAESWLLDFTSGELRTILVNDVSVLDWVRSR